MIEGKYFIFSFFVLVVMTFLSIDTYGTNKSFDDIIMLKKEDFKHHQMSIDTFKRWYSRDLLLRQYFNVDTSIYNAYASQKEIESGCLDWVLTNSYTFLGIYLYELSCDCWKKYSYNLWSPDLISDRHLLECYKRPYSAILVFVNKKGKLERINLMPLSRTRFSITRNDSSIRALMSFLKANSLRPKEMFREDLASLFISACCLYCPGEIPKKIEVVSETTNSSDIRMIFVAYYDNSRYKFEFSFSKSNKIKWVIGQEIY